MSQEQYIGLHTLIDLANIQSPERVIQVTHMPFYESWKLLWYIAPRLTSRHSFIIDVF
jgi:hypothetical protein